MIDFTTLQGLTIPEGNVTQITDASGNVLWKQAPSGATITIEGDGGDYAHIIIDGVTYNTATTLKVPLGTVITCETAHDYATYGANAYINYNLDAVATGQNAQYQYTVISDVTFHIDTRQLYAGAVAPYIYGCIDIMDKDAPSYATVHVSPNRPGTSASVTMAGKTYNSAPATVFVAIGITIQCVANWEKQYKQEVYVGGQILVNDVVVVDRDTSVNPTTYEYTVTGDVDISLRDINIPIGDYGSMGWGGSVYINES